jgi:hypothetical protein
MIPGKEVEIGGTRYTLPPLNIASLRKHREFMSQARQLADGSVEAGVEEVLKMTDIICDSFKRNYPEVNFAEIEEHLDIEKLTECFTAVMRVNGSGPAMGESKPASP